MMPLDIMAQMSDQYFAGQESYKSINEVLNSDSTEKWKGTNQLTEFRGEIEFNQVEFSYQLSQT